MLRWEAGREQPDGLGRARVLQAVRRLDLGGCLVMAIGGALALSDRRYRFARSTAGTSAEPRCRRRRLHKEVGPCATFGI